MFQIGIAFLECLNNPFMLSLLVDNANSFAETSMIWKIIVTK